MLVKTGEVESSAAAVAGIADVVDDGVDFEVSGFGDEVEFELPAMFLEVEAAGDVDEGGLVADGAGNYAGSFGFEVEIDRP